MFGVWAAGSAVADVSDSGGWSGEFGEDFAVGVGDLVAVSDDQDVLECAVGVDEVGDFLESETAVAGQASDLGVGGQVRRDRGFRFRLRGRWWCLSR